MEENKQASMSEQEQPNRHTPIETHTHTEAAQSCF